ncbi:MAG: FAD:protein FMN transferase [Deltaproteobacteria bacterium]|nr:FAD:protein FMN transferase [Deltaproteobacteria bacterium]
MLDRRAFLRLSGVGGMALATGAAASSLSSVKFNHEWRQVSKTRLQMGTFVNIAVFHESGSLGEEAVEAGFDLISQKESILSRFSDQSPVCALNREASLKDVAPEVSRALNLSVLFHRETDGAFDITVKPLLDLMRECFERSQKPPSREAVRRCLKSVGLGYMEMSPSGVFFRREGMGITLDGIAKGLIVDWTAEELTRRGIEHFLINAGGDIRVAGGKGDGAPWKIAIRDPKSSDSYAAIIRLRDGALATSGNYEVYFDREKLYHHIVNPWNGVSPRFYSSVSALAPRAVEADALSTAVFVMEPADGIAFMERRYGVEGFVITEDDRKLHTSGWKKYQT